MSKKSIAEASAQADKNAKKRDLEKDQKDPIKQSEKKLMENINELNEMTGAKFFLGQKRKRQNDKVAFLQVMTHNIQCLVENSYLTQAEESFLFRISAYVDFGSNVIVVKDYKNASKKENQGTLPEAANVSYISTLIGSKRETVSRIMNSLKKKGVLACGETGMITDDGRTCTSRTWFVNPNIMYCGDKNDIDRATQILFRNALRNITSKEGRKVKLPVRLFV